jgi:hypothetical protein
VSNNKSQTTVAGEPVGTLRIADTMLLQKQHAIYVDIIFEDETGRRWKMRKSAFLIDLEDMQNV